MNNLFPLLVDSFCYVYHQPLFWLSMGFTTSIGIFVGVLLYDGNTNEAHKGIISILSYVIMLLWTTGVRVIPITSALTYSYTKYGQPYASVATISYLTVFWTLGVLVGVNLFKHKNYKA